MKRLNWSFGQPSSLPRWAQLVLLPGLNLLTAALVTAAVIALLGENPWECLQILLDGAFGYGEGVGYTLFYSTGYIFTGLAVAMAFHARLFNIGGEGQVYIAGLGATLVMLALDQSLPAWLLLPLALLAALAFGALWAFLPGWLQAYRGSHIVVTTIMFNFIAASAMGFIVSKLLIEQGSQNPASRAFADAAGMPSMQSIGALFGVELPHTPLNAAFLLALLCCVLFYLAVWRSRWGLELRTVGTNPRAAACAGINVRRMIVVAMCVSGALAGLAAINELLGSAHRLNLNFPNGVGFVGIAVALMGRNHPVGIALSALLFGALTQGGLDLSLEKPLITLEMIIFIQGLIILFVGGLELLFVPLLSKLVRGSA
jgi:simple sugar transport system permease protein